MYQVRYIPRIENEVVIAEYEFLREAEIHMEQIQMTKPSVHKFHYIKEINNEEQNSQKFHSDENKT